MPKAKAILAAVLLPALLTACSAGAEGDVATLLRAPRLSGQSSAVQKALNSYVGGSATLKYPASGDFLSPFLFGDWDGDGTEEAAALYTTDTSSNVWLAVLEPTEAGDWHVTQVEQGLSSEVASVTYAHLKDPTSQQILVGYGSAQGDLYLAAYLYGEEEGLQVIIKQNYTEMIVADITGKGDTQDLVLTLPTEMENGGVNLQLLTNVEGEFRSTQTLAVGAGSYNGCAALRAGVGNDGAPYLVLDGWAGTGGSTLASAIIIYDAETGFLKTYSPPGLADPYRATLRYDASLLSMDIDANGTIDIPTEVSDGGTLSTPMDKRIRFLLWKDFSTNTGGNYSFGVYDSQWHMFLPLPESLHGNILIRSNQAGTGWLLCNAEGTSVYYELRLVDPAEENADYQRIATIGSQQLQVRMVTAYYGLTIDQIEKGIILLNR